MGILIFSGCFAQKNEKESQPIPLKNWACYGFQVPEFEQFFMCFVSKQAKVWIKQKDQSLSVLSIPRFSPKYTRNYEQFMNRKYLLRFPKTLVKKHQLDFPATFSYHLERKTYDLSTVKLLKKKGKEKFEMDFSYKDQMISELY